MAYECKYRFARISPRKARLIADLIRGKRFEEAMTVLDFSKRRGAVLVRKALQSAAANAEDQGELQLRDLVVTDARVDAGPTIKRWQPKDRGRAHPINKRTSHIFVAVDEG